MRRQSESSLVSEAFHSIRRKAGLLVCREVPLLGRSVDLAYVNNKTIVTIEFKIRDWRRALAQARDHLLASDYAYICMPRKKVSGTMRSEFSRTGVGLLFYSPSIQWPFETIITARKSNESYTSARSLLLDYIRTNDGANS